MPIELSANNFRTINQDVLIKQHNNLVKIATNKGVALLGAQLANAFEELGRVFTTDLKFQEAHFFWSNAQIVTYLTKEVYEMSLLNETHEKDPLSIEDKATLTKLIPVISTTLQACLKTKKEEFKELNTQNDVITTLFQKRVTVEQNITPQQHKPQNSSLQISISQPSEKTKTIDSTAAVIIREKIADSPPEEITPITQGAENRLKGRISAKHYGGLGKKIGTLALLMIGYMTASRTGIIPSPWRWSANPFTLTTSPAMPSGEGPFVVESPWENETQPFNTSYQVFSGDLETDSDLDAGKSRDLEKTLQDSAERSNPTEKPIAQPDAQAEKPVASEEPIAQPDTQHEKPVASEEPIAQPDAQSEKPVASEEPIAQPDSQSEKPVASEELIAQSDAQSEKPVASEELIAQPDSQSEKPVASEELIAQSDAQHEKPVASEKPIAQPDAQSEKPVSSIGSWLSIASLISITTAFLFSKFWRDKKNNEMALNIYDTSESPPIDWDNKENATEFPTFNKVLSNQLVPLTVETTNKSPLRSDFLKDSNYQTDPPFISASKWVPIKLIQFLMRNKRDVALGTKWIGGKITRNGRNGYDCITNMEGALHTFFTPLLKVNLTHDFLWRGENNSLKNPLMGKARPIIMSAAIHPDMELESPQDAVILKICELGEEEVFGSSLGEDFEILSITDKQNADSRAAYDEALQKHMIYHLTELHALPSIVGVKKIYDQTTAIDQIEKMIKKKNKPNSLQESAIKLDNGRVLSLEVLYNLYKEQLENELLALEKLCPQGYIYSIDPPNIFLDAIGGSKNGKFLNRLQALALKHIVDQGGLRNMKVLAFANFSDRQGLNYYELALTGQNIEVMSKHPLLGDSQKGSFLFNTKPFEYGIKAGWALVIHNNSDAFGQNIETEAFSSQDGALGSLSDAAHVLHRDREDLCQLIWHP